MTKRILLTVLLLLASWSVSLAAPAVPELLEVEQSDGTKFKAKIHGDEFQSWVEAVDSGHTVLQDNASGRWEYAERLPDGTLKRSGIKVDPTGKFAPDFLEKGVKPERDVEREREQSERLRDKLKTAWLPPFPAAATRV